MILRNIIFIILITSVICSKTDSKSKSKTNSRCKYNQDRKFKCNNTTSTTSMSNVSNASTTSTNVSSTLKVFGVETLKPETDNNVSSSLVTNTNINTVYIILGIVGGFIISGTIVFIVKKNKKRDEIADVNKTHVNPIYESNYNDILESNKTNTEYLTPVPVSKSNTLQNINNGDNGDNGDKEAVTEYAIYDLANNNSLNNNCDKSTSTNEKEDEKFIQCENAVLYDTVDIFESDEHLMQTHDYLSIHPLYVEANEKNR